MPRTASVPNPNMKRISRHLHEWHRGATEEQNCEDDDDQRCRDDDLTRLLVPEVHVKTKSKRDGTAQS